MASKEKTDGGERASRRRSMSLGAAEVRTRLAQLVWLLCVVMALFLAIAALTYALGANDRNALVEFVRDGAGIADLGVFGMDSPIKEFDGENAETKTALVNYGIGAVVWLVVGRVLDRVIRP